MVEVIKLFIIRLTVLLYEEKENYSSGSHQFTSDDARVAIHSSSQTQGKNQYKVISEIHHNDCHSLKKVF